jgi:hypothetical protein
LEYALPRSVGTRQRTLEWGLCGRSIGPEPTGGRTEITPPATVIRFSAQATTQLNMTGQKKAPPPTM